MLLKVSLLNIMLKIMNRSNIFSIYFKRERVLLFYLFLCNIIYLDLDAPFNYPSPFNWGMGWMSQDLVFKWVYVRPLTGITSGNISRDPL